VNVSEERRESIERELRALENEQGVRILYACESGSRAWGFASVDSDYDVRFLYVRPLRWYLSINIEHKRDVIERTTEDNLDLVGWDLKKGLLLLLKSNPSFLEWLRSPIVYRNQEDFQARLLRLAEQVFSADSCRFHYWRWAAQNYADYLTEPTVAYKKYLYVLRPLLAVLWLERGYGMVPMEFDTLMDRILEEPALQGAVKELLQAKSVARELNRGPRIPAIHDFVTREFSRLQAQEMPRPERRPFLKAVDEFFFGVLTQS
jgi:hypothetical protein